MVLTHRVAKLRGGISLVEIPKIQPGGALQPLGVNETGDLRASGLPADRQMPYTSCVPLSIKGIRDEHH